MDLQLQRHLEEFLRLLDIGQVQWRPQMEFCLPPLRLLIELRDERILMSTLLELEPHRLREQWCQILAQWRPERSLGVPLRIFATRRELVLSCALPETCDAMLWLNLFHCQRKLLERALGASV